MYPIISPLWTDLCIWGFLESFDRNNPEFGKKRLESKLFKKVCQKFLEYEILL